MLHEAINSRDTGMLRAAVVIGKKASAEAMLVDRAQRILDDQDHEAECMANLTDGISSRDILTLQGAIVQGDKIRACSGLVGEASQILQLEMWKAAAATKLHEA